MSLRRPQAPITNYWTPRKVVATLERYPHLKSESQSGTLMAMALDGESGGMGTWESGGRMEKQVCRTADIELAVKRLDDRYQKAICLYYLDGYHRYADVARKLRIAESTAAEWVGRGVEAVATRLCGGRAAGKEAVSLMGTITTD